MHFLHKLKRKNRLTKFGVPDIQKKCTAQFGTQAHDNTYNDYLETKDKQERHLGIKALCLSDTHGILLRKNDYLDNGLCKNPDIILCLGDIWKYELCMLMERKGSIPCFAIRGNHDSCDQFDGLDIINVNGIMAEYKSFKITGMEGSIKYNQTVIGFTQAESLEFAKTIPCGADIFLTHSHIYRQDDTLLPGSDSHIGLIGSRWYYNNNDCINLHGHDHGRENKYKEEINTYKVYGIQIIDI